MELNLNKKIDDENQLINTSNLNIISNNDRKNDDEDINIKNEPRHHITSNYLKQIKKIYEDDKNSFEEKNFYLEQKINSDKGIYEQKLNNLKNELKEIQLRNENNLRLIKENHQTNIKNIILEKDQEMKYSLNNVKELEKLNKELKRELDQYMNKYSEEKINYNNILTNLEFILNKLQKENSNIKEYYENRINFIMDNFDKEKNKMIKSHEDNIISLKNKYEEEKDKYIKYISLKDSDYENNMKENEEKLNKLREKKKDLNSKLNALIKRRDELIKKNKILNEQNISNNINMDKTTKELIFEIKRKEEENTRHAEKMKEYIKAKKENKKMKKIYRFKRSNSAVY